MNDYIELSIQINPLRHKIEQALLKGHFAKAHVYSGQLQTVLTKLNIWLEARVMQDD